jgi:citrate lyase subunit beta / citryl-CoA lyase
MIFDSLDFITALGEEHEALVGLCHKSIREQNLKRQFKAPLMVSAHQLKHLNKIDELDCDAVIINLEDGVAQEKKALALSYALIFISHLQQSDKKVIVRVNALDEGGDKEIEALNEVFPDAIRVPKIRTADEVHKLSKLIHARIDIHLSIETKESWVALADLRLTPRVTHFYLGILDLFADLSLSQSMVNISNPTMLYMLSHFLITSRSIGVEPVSFVYQEHKNSKVFNEWIRLEKEMGFSAKGVISPLQASQVMVLHEDSSELERAQHIIKSFEENRANGVTGFVDDVYGFIDEPIYKGALVIKDKHGI